MILPPIEIEIEDTGELRLRKRVVAEFQNLSGEAFVRHFVSGQPLAVARIRKGTALRMKGMKEYILPEDALVDIEGLFCDVSPEILDDAEEQVQEYDLIARSRLWSVKP